MSSDDAKLTGIQFAVTTAALDGDPSAVFHLLNELLGQGMPFESVLFDVIAPVQRALGERWLSGDYLIAEEHVTTDTIETVVSLLAGSFEQPSDAPRVVISCVEGEAHSLPGRMLAAHLLSEGFRTVHLGASIPAADLQRFLVEEPPDAVVLTCTMTGHLLGARKAIEACHAAGAPVVVGGPAFGSTGERASKLGADAWVAQLRDVADVLRTWEPDPTSAAAGALEPASDLAGLAAARPTVVALAATALGGSTDRSAEHQEGVELAFEALAAAMTIQEDQLLLDFADWMARHDRGQNGSGPSASRVLAALRESIDPRYEEARRKVQAAISHISGG